MANVLYVRANPKNEEHSNSSQLANFFIIEYRKHHPDDTIDKLDLYTADIPFLDVDVFSAWGKFASNDELTVVEREKAERMDKLTNQFLEADKVIFAYPFWNLSLPPMLKAYIDTICINGKTFHYTEDGLEGLVPDKPFLLIETRGGFYSEGPAAELEHSENISERSSNLSVLIILIVSLQKGLMWMKLPAMLHWKKQKNNWQS